MTKNNDFFDDAEFEKGRESVSRNDKYVPLIYASEAGSYTFRPYLEKHESGYRFMRSVFSNQLNSNDRVIAPPNKDDTNEIQDIALDAMAKGLVSSRNGAWKHKTQSSGIMMVHLIKGPKKYEKYNNKAVGLVFQWQHRSAWQSFEENFDPDVEGMTLRDYMKSSFNLELAPAIRMVVEKEKKNNKMETNVDLSTTRKDINLPSMDEGLPEGVDYKGLDYLYVAIDKKPTKKQLIEFKAYITQQLQDLDNFKSSNQYEPGANDDDEMGKGYTPKTRSRKEAKVEDKYDFDDIDVDDMDLDDEVMPGKKPREEAEIASPSSISANEKCLIVKQKAKGLIPLAEYQEVAFGSYPDDDNMYCMSCDNQLKCMEI